MDECFICCTVDRKSTQEHLEEFVLNKKTRIYPIIKLSQAYGCACVGTYAHNKCLLGINKCPTCRKIVSKPNLYVITHYDKTFGWIFQLIKSDPTLISKLEISATIITLILIGLLWLIYEDLIKININYKMQAVIIILLMCQLVTGISFIVIDYFKKYWLYDEKTNKINSL